MANNLTVTGNVAVGGTLVVTGTTNLGAALDTNLVTNFNADKVDGADLSTDGTFAANSDVLVPSQKAVKTYADLRALDAAVVHDTGNETVAGIKTFSSIPVLPASDPTTDNQAVRKAYFASATASKANGIVETGAGVATLKCKLIEIGDWNMDTTHTVSIAHGLTTTAIRNVRVAIINDGETDVHFDTAPILNPADGTLSGGAVQFSAYVAGANIVLVRLAGGLYDSAGWDATSFNRGWITIWYEA